MFGSGFSIGKAGTIDFLDIDNDWIPEFAGDHWASSWLWWIEFQPVYFGRDNRMGTRANNRDSINRDLVQKGEMESKSIELW